VLDAPQLVVRVETNSADAVVRLVVYSFQPASARVLASSSRFTDFVASDRWI
jgi:hypothetical protein